MEGSTVSLSACEGIEGLINDGRMSYYLEPLTQDSFDRRFHLFYRLQDVISDDFYSPEKVIKHDEGVNAMNDQREAVSGSIYTKNLGFRGRIRRAVFTETKYVELVIINDNKQFEASGKNLTKVNLRAKLIANIVDSIFKPLNVRVVLVAIETWDLADMIKADDDADTYLANLIKYRKRTLLYKYPNDVTKLLTGVKLKDSVRGKARVMSICTRQSAGIIQDYSSNAAFTANTFAHELGHVFGMYHDEDLPNCVCNAPKTQGCVMSARVGRQPATVFSNCSVKGLQEGLSRGLGTCLFNVPDTLYGGPLCGDGILGQGEECDCGTSQECKDKGDTCCDHVTCKLRAHAQCGSGACCEKCRFKKRGTLCRENANQCDIPETCTGSSGMCPVNMFVHNGYPCSNDTAYCYFGECMTHYKQCQDLWGNNATPGPDKCYHYHNTRGDKFGHCRKTRKGKYRACKLQDAKCGKLWCLSGRQRPVIGIQRDVMSSFWLVGDEKITCKGTSLLMGLDAPEAAMTLEGTKCGDGKVCLNRQCRPLQVLLKKIPRCPSNCSGHGLCNNVGRCYCFEPWTGESCSEKIEDVKPTSETIASIKTLLFSPKQTHLSTEKPRQITTTGTLTPDASLGDDSTVVYIAVSLSLVALCVILVVVYCRYKHYHKHRKFVVQKRTKKTTISSNTKVIVVQ